MYITYREALAGWLEAHGFFTRRFGTVAQAKSAVSVTTWSVHKFNESEDLLQMVLQVMCSEEADG